MRNDDVSAGREYNMLYLYLRKLLFSNSPRYNLTESGWEDHGDFATYFDEKKVGAFNFNLLLVNYFYDTLREENDGNDANRIYPLKIPITNNLVFDPDEEIVLEVRLIIKNFVKLYEYNRLDYTSDRPYVVHYFGVSDWLRDVKAGDGTIGGNLIAVARTYVRGKTGNVSGTQAGAKYVIGIPAGADINEYTMPPLDPAPDDTLRGTKIKYSDIPTMPTPARDTMPALLTYYMQLEKYKSDYNKFLGDVAANYNTGGNTYSTPQELFEAEWTNYNDTANNFNIPPLATYCGAGGNYEITNIAPGIYDFYYTTNEPAWGKLFDYEDFSASGLGNTIVTNKVINAGASITLP
jgi:hypothetical protein